jgi:hypothetical protein
MRRCSKLAVACALFLLCVSLSAFANSSNGGFSNVSLTGVSGTASGSFTFNFANDTFSKLTLAFNGGVFNGMGAKNGGGNATCLLGVCGFFWKTQMANGDWAWDTILINIRTGQYQAYGGISNWQHQGDFKYNMAVPEGGTALAYLMLSGFAIFAAILIAGKRRRTRAAQFI